MVPVPLQQRRFSKSASLIIAKEGYLKKKQKRSGQFGPTYLQVKGNFLIYDGKKQKKVLSLHSVSPQVGETACEFKLHIANQRTIIFQTENEEERNAWLSLLEKPLIPRVRNRNNAFVEFQKKNTDQNTNGMLDPSDQDWFDPCSIPSNKLPLFLVRDQLTPAAAVLCQRDGHVLGQNMMLKLDNFKGKISESIQGNYDHMSLISIPVSGIISNWYQITNIPVFGIGQSTLHGIRTVLNLLDAHGQFGQDVLWINLREEAMIYINGRPFVLRDGKHPFREMISFRNVGIEQVEKRLQKDIYKEIEQHRNNILVHRETSHMEIQPFWESVSRESVRTVEEVFDVLSQEGYKVKYRRVGVSAGNAPGIVQMDQIYRIITENSGKTTRFIFNSRGRGRAMAAMTTAAMYLYYCKNIDIPGDRSFNRAVQSKSTTQKIRLSSVSGNILVKRRSGKKVILDYDVIQKVIRLLHNGQDAKFQVDSVISHFFGGASDLRKLIKETEMLTFSAEAGDASRDQYVEKFREQLRHYISLICFESFLMDIKPTASTKTGFKHWMDGSHGITHLLKEQFSSDGNLLQHKKKNKYAHLSKPMRIAFDSRKGTILSPGTIILSDIVGRDENNSESDDNSNRPSAENPSTLNYQNLGLVSTTAQPTLSGIRKILKDTNAKDEQVLWVDLRLEPFVYINSYPFCLRGQDNPLNPMSEFNAKLSVEKVKQLTERFVNEIQQQLTRTEDGMYRIPAHKKKPPHLTESEEKNKSLDDLNMDENENSETQGNELEKKEKNPAVVDKSEEKEKIRSVDIVVEPFWLKLRNRNEVKTMEQLFTQLQSEKYKVKYVRLPFSHRETTLDFFDRLLSNGAAGGLTDKISRVVISSIGGRSRCGMMSVVYSLLFLLKSSKNQSPRSIPTPLEMSFSPSGTAFNVTLSLPMADPENIVHRRLLRGDFKCVLELTRALKGGVDRRKEVDLLIDYCGRYFHIRHTILSNLQKAEQERHSKRRRVILKRAKVLLQRYMYIVCYNAYLRVAFKNTQTVKIKHLTKGKRRGSSIILAGKRNSLTLQTPIEKNIFENQKSKNPSISFKVWLDTLPEVQSVLRSFDENPERSLKLSLGLKGKNAERDAAVLEKRRGNILFGWCMLKPDHFPGLHRKHIKPSIPGAPNFRQFSKLPICGLAIPSVAGIVSVLEYVKVCPFTKDYASHVTWINMREEPVLYIHKIPFVFRDIDTPWRNVNSFRGISTQRLEEMERQLKQDVLDESKNYESKILCHDEIEGKLQGYWETLDEENSVQSTIEAYETGFHKAKEVFGVQAVLARVPVTDEQPPEIGDFDDILQILKNAPENSLFIFNCQQGRGRTTTGMVIAALWYKKRKESKEIIRVPISNIVTGGYMSYVTLSCNINITVQELKEKILDTIKNKKLKSSINKTSQFKIKFKENELMENSKLYDQVLSVPTKQRKKILSQGLSIVKLESMPQSPKSQKETKRIISTGTVFKVDVHKELENGNFEVIKKLVRELEDGPKLKKDLDAVIDSCTTLSNLRESIFEYKERADNALKEKRRIEFTEKGEWALQRYFYLLAFNAFLKCFYENLELGSRENPTDLAGFISKEVTKTKKKGGASGTMNGVPSTFENWLQSRPEVYSMIEECKLA